MKNRYLITITTVHGTKHYSFKQIVKYIIGIVALFIVLVLLFGYGYITYLKSKIGVIEKEKQELHQQVASLTDQLQKLNVSLVQKQERLSDLSDKIEDLEQILGLKGDEYKQQLQNLKISTLDASAIVHLIPSGKPVVQEFRISAGFGWRKHPILHKKEFHPGIDLAAKGKVPIFATANGIIIDAKHGRYGYGNVIKIAHVYGFSTLYGHLRKILVKKGDFVKKGQIIGYMGSTGLSTGQHLHYEVRFDKKPLNPLNFIRWSNSNFYTITEKERHVPWESLIKALKAVDSQKRLQSSPKVQKSKESSPSTQTSISTEK
ncbi:peptidoglycan DD-metalloendopeptidase family protein [Nitratiruptor sp. YY09-18]|uniref:peptidoglycan DD-metalloendopeptidase family protein n=1 Tax=Nitratiruptor sp. YY09-18 TaxID=2724901 RepID=UPI001916563C|nr:peptidoglycan DD-metalloendopeptidase family protein [Nitratiruptor sp. YY09-18]BCD67316.1 peptidase, M23/M37 family [Nitratiruptor sp. YY09-18]